VAELTPEERTRYRIQLEGNPVFQELRLERDALHEQNILLRSLARDHCPDSHGSLYIHMQPNRMDERGAASKTSAVARDVNIDFDSDGNVFGIEILNVPSLVSAARMDEVDPHWRNG
jgi:uncharacterized protein YuzE